MLKTSKVSAITSIVSNSLLEMWWFKLFKKLNLCPEMGVPFLVSPERLRVMLFVRP